MDERWLKVTECYTRLACDLFYAYFCTPFVSASIRTRWPELGPPKRTAIFNTTRLSIKKKAVYFTYARKMLWQVTGQVSAQGSSSNARITRSCLFWPELGRLFCVWFLLDNSFFSKPWKKCPLWFLEGMFVSLWVLAEHVSYLKSEKSRNVL